MPEVVNIFIYGTLMYDEVWNRVTRGHYLSEAACISGFRRLKIRGEVYPGLIKGEGKVSGIVRQKIAPDDLARLDQFEADFYERITVTARTESGAELAVEVYVVEKSYLHILENIDWDTEEFEKSGLHKFTSSYENFDI